MSIATHDPATTEDIERAEALLLGSIFLHPKKVITVQAMLQPEDFSQNRHRLIYETLLTVNGTSELDLVRAVSILLTPDELERIGGVPYLSLLKQQAESTAMHVEEQAYQLKQAILNRLLSKAKETLHSHIAQNDGDDLNQAIGDLERALSITQQLFSPKYELPPSTSPFQVDLDGYLSDLETRRKKHMAFTGIPTGFADLDTITGGLQRGDLIVVAGPPSIGKTGFALSIALYVLLNAHRSVGLFSLEAPKKQVIGRLLSMQANLDQRLLRSLEMEDDNWSLLMEASVNLSEAYLWIDDSANLSTAQLHDTAHMLVERYGVELLIVDYVHLMLSSIHDRKHENRVQEVGEISRSLKVLARDLNIPVLVLSQVSRAFESRPTKKLQLSDLRDGSLENDADLVLFLSVDEKETTRTADCLLATISIAKHRNGPRAELDVCFCPCSTQFRDLRALAQPSSQEKLSSSLPTSPDQPLRPFPRLKDILEQAMQRQPKHEKLKTELKSSSGRRELPRGYVFDDEEEESESESDGTMMPFEDEQEQSHERT
jgi:replicative DNA helicase